ncbi:unnamed protein product [Brassica napus]|nr:unnamed protein product [Brassica napus]
MELVFCSHDYTKKMVHLAVTGFCGYAFTWWDKVSKTRRFNGEPHVSLWFEIKAIMKKRFASRSYGQLDLNESPSSLSRILHPQFSSSKTSCSSHDYGSVDMKEKKPRRCKSMGNQQPAKDNEIG